MTEKTSEFVYSLKGLLDSYDKAMPLDEPHKLEDFTCFECVHFRTCEVAWDLYNTNGECAAEK